MNKFIAKQEKKKSKLTMLKDFLIKDLTNSENYKKILIIYQIFLEIY